MGSKTNLSVVEVLEMMRKINMRPTKAYAEEMLRIVDANNDDLLQVGLRSYRSGLIRFFSASHNTTLSQTTTTVL